MTPAITDTISWWAPFEALEPGQEFTTRGRTVTEADVVGFASLTGDWHPQHSDAEWAASSPFGERIAHGHARRLAGRRPRAVRPGPRGRAAPGRATRRSSGRCASATRCASRAGSPSSAPASEEAGLVTFAWNVVNQDGRTVCRARVEVLWKRDVLAEIEPERDADFVPIPL